MILVEESPRDAAHLCARHVLEVLEEAVQGSHDAAIAVSGGSTPKMMFESLAAAGFDWTHVHLFWVDERVVPATDEQSNYKLAAEVLIEPAGIPAVNVHRVLGELEPEEAAARYCDELRDFFSLTAGAVPIFDVIHCGMGPDAHTASLFPGDPLTSDRTGLAASVFAPKLPNWRVTLLPPVLLNARNMFLLVTGADKADTLLDVMTLEYDALKRPVQILHREGRNTTWFLDRAAAARI